MSVIIEEAIRAWMAANPGVRERAARAALERFLKTLGEGGAPTPAEVAEASAAARDSAFAVLGADAVLDSLPIPPADAAAREALRGRWSGLCPDWALPPPPGGGRTLATPRLAWAAAGGGVAGMLFFGAVLNLSLDLRALGMLIGAPLGAAGAVYGVGRLAESKSLRRVLGTLVGVAGTLDLARVATLGAAGLWGRLAGMGLLRRLVFYPGIMALLGFTRGETRYDRGAYREAIAALIRGQVDGAAVLLCSLAQVPDAGPRAALLDRDLAHAILDLHGADLAGLPAAAESVLLEGRRLGLGGLDTPARFAVHIQSRVQNKVPNGVPDRVPDGAADGRVRLCWEPGLAARYRTFGLIEAGDTVIVEDEPVIQNDRILEKGLVRKQRG